MDDTSALPTVVTKPRPRLAAVVGGLGAAAVCFWGAAVYLVPSSHPDDLTVLVLCLATTLSVVTAVVWSVWHLRSKGSFEHRTELAQQLELGRRVEALQLSVATIGREVGARIRQAQTDGYVEAAHDFGVNPAGGDEPPRNTRAAFLRPVPGGRGDVG